MYPPATENLFLMRSEDGQHARMIRLGRQLKGGIVLRTTSEKAVYIPAGCLHAVFTTRGGFLVSTDFTTRDSISAFSRVLEWNLHRALDAKGQQECFYLYLSCVSVALHNGRTAEALKGWISTEERLRAFASGDREWRTAAEECWSTVLSGQEAARSVCACGAMKGNVSFEEHLKATHLNFVLPPETVVLQGRRHKRARCN